MDSLTWGRHIEQRIGSTRLRTFGIWGTVMLGVCYELVQVVVCWRYAAVMPMNPDALFLWAIAFGVGFAPPALLWRGLQVLRQAPSLPDDLANQYVSRLVSFATTLYLSLGFMDRLVVLALDRLR